MSFFSKSMKRTVALTVAFILILSSFFNIIISQVSAGSVENMFNSPIIGESILDFSNSDDYVITNTEESKYYGYITGSTLSDGISVSDGVLKLNSGYQTSKKRTVQTWVVNKNGQPIELVSGVEYKVSFKIRQTSAASGQSTTYLSLSNGICLNDESWFGSLSATASVMPDNNIQYSYLSGNKQNSNLTTYPNNAIYASSEANHVCYVKNGRYMVEEDWQPVESTFVAYDITSNGANSDNKNYLALTFGLYTGQQIEIDDFEITYDYSKYTCVTLINGETSTKTILEVGAEIGSLTDNGDTRFVGWYNGDELVTTVPKDAEDGAITLNAKWYNAFEASETINKENGYIINYDFDSGAGIEYFMSNSYVGREDNNGNIAVVDNALVAKSNSGETSQLWVVNKNGNPFLIKKGITYKVSFDLSYTGATRPEIMLSNGIQKNDSVWNGSAPINPEMVTEFDSDNKCTKSFVGVDVTNNGENQNKRNYLALVIKLSDGQSAIIDNISITYDYEKHTLVEYQYDPTDTEETEVILSNVGDNLKTVSFVNDRKFVEWKYNGITVTNVVSDLSTGKMLVVAELEADPLEGLTKYDFSKKSHYKIDNTNGKYITTYFGGISSSITPEIESGIDISDGKLKLTSGLQDSESYSNKRTVKAWIINKNGVPFEFTPGITYAINFTIKQNGVPSENGTYISIANGVYYNDNSWQDYIGTSASIMPAAKGVTYTYQHGNGWQWPSDGLTTYPNNAVKASNNNKVAYGTEEGITKTSVSLTFTAYDISTQGEKYKNHLALIYSLSGSQEIEIDDITIHEPERDTIVTYDYRNGNIKTEFKSVGSDITVADLQDIPTGRKQAGWRDAEGNVYTSVPKGNNGKITLYPNIVRETELDNVTEPLKWIYDFEFADEHETSNTEDAVFTTLYKGGISGALQSVIQNDIKVENGALKIGSGIPTDANYGTSHNIQTWIINHNGKPVELKPGTRYTVNFKVKQKSSPLYAGTSYISLSNGVCFNDNPWQNKLGASASVMKDTDQYTYMTGNGWRWPEDGLEEYPNNAVKASNDNKLIYGNTISGLKSDDIICTFTAYDITDGGKNKDCKNYLALTVALCAGQEIEIDDLIIFETDKYNFVSYNLGGYGSMDSFFCKKGDVIKLTDLPDTKEAYFAGWYTDALYINKVKNNSYTIGEDDVVFYARYIKFETIEDFENYAGKTFRYEGQTSRNPQLGYYSFITDKFSKDGKYSLHVNALGNERNETWVKLTDNGSDFKVASGQTYFFTIDYYVENIENDLEMYPYISGSEGIWEQATIDGKLKGVYKEQTDFTMNISSSDKGKGWKQLTFLFTPTLKYENYNSLYFKFNNLVEGTSIYFDNFKAQLITSKDAVVSIYPNNGENPIAMLAKVGQKFTLPTLSSKLMNFVGWYTDVELKTSYNGDGVITSNELTLFAKWKYKKGVKLNEGFENYKGVLPSSDFSIDTSDPASGEKCLKYAFEPRADKTDYFSLYIDENVIPISNGQRFAMSFKYKILEEELPDTNLPLGFTTANKKKLKIEQYDNFYFWTFNYIPGEWHVFNDILTAETLKAGDNIIKFAVGSMGEFKGTVYIDDITLVPLEEDDVVLTVYTDQLSTNLPTHIIGKPGDSFTYPKEATRTVGSWFLGGWCTDRWLNNLVTQEEGVFLPGEDLKVWARWCKKSIFEGFEKDFADLSGIPGLKNIGDDYEIYDSSIKGFNKSNVKTGSSSLHRIGNSHMWKNTQVLLGDNSLAVGRKYQMTFFVKMDKNIHTDGSIRIISNGVRQTGYDTLGEYLNVVNIADLTDGEWHKVTFNFLALSEYLSISTPGYCSLYIDDLSLKLLDDSAEISDSVYCPNEYEPLLRDSDGNIIVNGLEKLSIFDSTLKLNTNKKDVSNNNIITYVVIAVSSVLIVCAIVLGIILIRKSKSKRKVIEE